MHDETASPTPALAAPLRRPGRRVLRTEPTVRSCFVRSGSPWRVMGCRWRVNVLGSRLRLTAITEALASSAMSSRVLVAVLLALGLAAAPASAARKVTRLGRPHHPR